MAQKKLFQDGQTIKHDGQDLKIVKSLSSGLTGEVYTALLSVSGQKDPVNVVVKAMKALDFPLARQLFYKEGETLASLMHLEEETPDSLAGNLKIAPNYYGLSEHQPDPDTQGFPYLVMEFIPGTQVPELLKKQGTFSEKQALTIAWHLYRILDILHTRLLKTFVDLKFENLWWLKNDGKLGGGQLKLTDFGTLEEIKPGDEKKRGVARDVLLGGVYLLSMLTGYTLEYSIGELKEPARPVINSAKDNITWGTRRLLQKLLHQNIEARYKNAADVLVELRQLVYFWSQPSDQLAKMAQTALLLGENEAELVKINKRPLSDKGLAAALRACSAQDILRVNAPQLYNENESQRAQSLILDNDYFQRGYALLLGRSYTLARQTFEEGLSWTDDSAFLRRWSYMATIGERIAPSLFEANLKKGEIFLDLVNSGQFDSALDIRLPEFSQQLQSDGLRWLEEDAKMNLNFEAAQKAFVSGNFSKSAELYLITLTHLAELPISHQEIIGKYELGDIRKLAEQARELANSTERSLALYQEAETLLKNGEIGLVVKTVCDAYESDKFASFRFMKLKELTELALKLAVKNPSKVEEYLYVSRHIVEIGLHDFGKERGDLPYDNLCQASAKLDMAIQNLSLSDHVDFCATLEEVHVLLGEQGSLVEGVAVYAAGRVAQQPLFIEALANSIEKIIPSSEYPAKWREEALEISQRQSAVYRKQVDEFMREIYYVLLPIIPDAENPKTLEEILQVAAEYAGIPHGLDLVGLRDSLERLKRSEKFLEKVKSLKIEDEDIEKKILSLSEAVTNGIQSAQAAKAEQIQVQEAEHHARISFLSEDRNKIQEQLDWIKQNQQGEFKSNSQIALYQLLREQLLDFLYRCYQAKTGSPENIDASLDIHANWAIHALNMLGVAGWKQLSELASERIEYFESTFKQANEDFARGDLERVRVVLDSTRTELDSAPEWLALNVVFAQARDWIAWCESKSEQFQSAKADAGLLRDLRFFSDLGLPAVYWEHSPADSYLDQAFAGLQADLQSDIKSSNIYHEKFVDILRGLLDVTWTKQLAVSSKEQRAWKMAEWLQGAYERARSKDKNARGLLAYISQTLPPENIDDALVSFTYADWDNLRLAEKHRRDAENKRRKSLLAVGITLSVCLVLAVAGILGYVANKERISQIVNGTYTPSPTLTPTLTSTPTLTPTITLTPTETPTLTPVPPSKFLLQDVGSLYPASPINGDAYWLVNDTDAVIAPLPGGPEKVWKDAISSDKNANSEKFIYTVIGNANIAWVMDMPFDVAGYYQIFVLDTQQYSSQLQSFNVFLDQQLVQPYRGASRVIFQDVQQKTDAWVSLGVYQANAGQTLAVQFAIGELTDKTPFAVDRLLVVRLNESTRQMLDQLPAGRPLVSLLDDPAVRFFEVVGDEPKQVKDRGALFNDVQAWNGSFTSCPLNEPLTIPVWVEWTPENRLSAGTYEVYVWIPALHATVVADYFLLVDGKEVNRPNPATINQKDHAGKWLSLGTWNLPQESMVSLRMVVAAGVTGEIGVDAVAIVRVQ